MIINHNLMANNAIRNTNVNSSNASKSMQKLSSGLRINGAADDAAGLAISEKMRGQIRGLDQASSNAQDGISLAQTAEGALGETTSILQRMRELSVQSATDTNTADDRSKIQAETDELAKEITRISNTTEFNSQNLLNGGVQTGNVGELTFQVGANSGQNLSLNIKAMDANTLGVARDAKTGTIDTTNTAKISSAEVDNGIEANDKLAAGTYTVTVASVGAGAATSAKTGAVVIGSGLTSGTASEDTNVTLTRTAGAAATAGTLSGTANLTSATAASGDAGNLVFKVDGGTAKTAAIATGDTKAQIITKINTAAGSTVVADDGSGHIKFTSGTTGGSSSIEIDATSTSATLAFTGFTSAATNTGSAAGSESWVATGDATGTKASNFTVNDITVDMSKLSGSAVGDTVTITGSKDASTTVQLFDSTGSTAIGSAVKIDQKIGGTYSIGDNATGKMSVKFNPGEAAVGSSTVTVAETASHAATFANGQTEDAAVVSGGIDVSTQSAANLAITKIDNAVKTVSSERSKLGAYQNRLEHTINNLGTSSENLTSAESRIRDVDMAKEMSTYSKNNILSQAAQAMIAQANQQPSQVLQLLR